MTISHIDHIVLTVKNIEVSIKFYTTVLGFREVSFANGRKALAFGNQKINLHQEGHEINPKAGNPTPGSADLCFISEMDIEQVLHELTTKQIRIVEGIVERSGAMGKIRSLYLRDPDNNLIEISNYV